MPRSEPRRLRIVVPRYGEGVVGGSESLTRGLATALTERGWRIEVWTTTALDEATWANALAPGIDDDRGVTVRRFPTVRRRHPGVFHQASRLFFRAPSRLRPERLWLRCQGPDAPGLLRALTAADPCPTLFTPYLYRPAVEGIHRAPRPRLMIPAAHDEPPLRLRAVGRALAAADALLFNSQEERELLLSVHPRAAELPSRVGTVGIVPPARIDAERFRHGRRLTGPYLLFGGRAATGKGLEELLDGVRQLRRRRPDVQLVLTGEAGVHLALPEGVVAAGRLDPPERWQALAGAAAVVVPGTLESLSLLALEGWAAGRPCILNAASPVLAGQSARSGGALTYRGAAELAAAAEHLVADPVLASRLGSAGRAHVAAAYGWDGVERRLTDLIGEARRGMR